MPSASATGGISVRLGMRWLSRGVQGLAPSAVELGVQQAVDCGWSLDDVRPYCQRCGETVLRGREDQSGCSVCLGIDVGWDRIVRLDRYGSPVSDWVVAMKFAGAWSWGPWLGRALADTIGDNGDKLGRVVVCAVPMHWRRRYRRGYNQSRLMADALAHRRGWVSVPLLRRCRYTLPQTSVAMDDRRANVRGSFEACRVDLSGWDVWLVDDVKTTGHTLRSCVALLRGAGAQRVNVAVAAVAGLDSKA